MKLLVFLASSVLILLAAVLMLYLMRFSKPVEATHSESPTMEALPLTAPTATPIPEAHIFAVSNGD